MRMTNDALERFRGWPTFTMNDAYVYLSQRNKNATRKSVQVTLSRLVRGGAGCTMSPREYSALGTGQNIPDSHFPRFITAGFRP